MIGAAPPEALPRLPPLCFAEGDDSLAAGRPLLAVSHIGHASFKPVLQLFDLLIYLEQPALDWLWIFIETAEILSSQSAIRYKNILLRTVAAAHGIALHAPDLLHQRGLQHIQHCAVVHSSSAT